MKRTFFVLLLCFISGMIYGAIENLTKITEISSDIHNDYLLKVSRDELSIYFLHSSSTFPQKNDDTMISGTRTSVSNPFSDIYSYTFSNINQDDYLTRNAWISDDGLRIYYEREDGIYPYNADIMFSSRTFKTDTFPSATIISEISDSSFDERKPLLCNNELTIYFTSDKDGNTALYRATRTNLSSPFGTPEKVDEINAYWDTVLDISENEHKMILESFDFFTGYKLLYTERSSISQDFPEPYQIGVISGPCYASMNSAWNRIYLSADIDTTKDIYVGDMNLITPTPSPTPSPSPTSSLTPTPTPNPVYPSPEPQIQIYISKEQITAYTGSQANPTGGVFDSQGCFIFFDQKYDNLIGTIYGTNQLLRVDLSSGTPVFTTIATQSDLAAVDPSWNNTYSQPNFVSMDILSDDSIVMLTSSYIYPLLKITQQTPAQITVIADYTTMSTIPAPIAVDRSVNPNIIYYGIYNSIYKVLADSIHGSPTLVGTYNSSYVYGMTLNENNDLIVGGKSLTLDNISIINKTTGANTIIVNDLMNSLPICNRVLALAFNSQNGEILGLAQSYYPNSNSLYNIFKITKDTMSVYSIKYYVTEYQILTDPDVSGHCIYPPDHFWALGTGFVIGPDKKWLYISNGTPTGSVSVVTGKGTGNIIRISTENLLKTSNNWIKYE